MHKNVEFVHYCNEIGRDKELVQGGGGNISLKLNKSIMMIKSSGVDLTEVTNGHGFVKVKYQNVADYIKYAKPCDFTLKIEKEYNMMLANELAQESTARPSIETGFHAVLGSAVIHTHPVIFNAVSCSKNGQKLMKEIFDGEDFLWIPYKTPGIALSKEVFNRIKKKRGAIKEKAALVFLENHGLIVSAGTLSECSHNTGRIIDKIKSYLIARNIKVYDYETFDAHGTHNKKFKSCLVSVFMEKKSNQNLLKNYIFPDSIVYCSCGFSFNKPSAEKIALYDSGLIVLPKKSAIRPKNMIETLIAMIYILLLIRQFDKPKYISKEEENNIKNMESEKYRQKAMESWE